MVLDFFHKSCQKSITNDHAWLPTDDISEQEKNTAVNVNIMSYIIPCVLINE